MVLVDSSVWIDFFRGGNSSQKLSELINANLVCTNELILTELIPYILHKGQSEVVESLLVIENIELNISWEAIRALQLNNLKNGLNNMGIPDLIIAQQSMEKNLELFTLDKHFVKIAELVEIKLFT